ncbi:MAG: hypothetical protein EAZ37_14210 [Burkholderiales bacterium]|nr:MAG: hypothetical protein EAZ37_14210 [Burkholderiales bacterium]
MEVSGVKSAQEKKSVTAEDWQRVLAASQVVTSLKDEGEGITSWFACFRESEPDLSTNKKICLNKSFAKRDVFRKMYFFKSGINSAIPSTVSGWNYVISYISLPDNKLPKLMLSPRYFSKDGWLFMSRVSVLADNELIFDRTFEKLDVDRTNESYGVEEIIHLVITDDEIKSLRKLAAANSISIRLTGDKGHVSVSQKAVKGFKEEIANILFVYDRLHKNLKDVIPAPKSE